MKTKLWDYTFGTLLGILLMSAWMLIFRLAYSQDMPPKPPYNEWQTNVVIMAWETNSVTGMFRVLRPATPDEIVASGWLYRRITNEPPRLMLTNSAIAHPERKHRVMGYKKECPECGVSLVSTNITSWIVVEDTNSVKMISVSFECLGCDETYIETFRKPIRKTKVEEITVEVVK